MVAKGSAAASPALPSQGNPVLTAFVKRVRRFKRVVGVFAEGCEHQRDVLVLLDGDTHNRTRFLVYDAEAAAHRTAGSARFDFQVMDATDYPDRELCELIPTDWVTLWAREPDRMAAARGRSIGDGLSSLEGARR